MNDFFLKDDDEEKNLGRFAGSLQEQVNECISRIEAIKIRILGNHAFNDFEKIDILRELDVLRSSYLNLIAVVPYQGKVTDSDKANPNIELFDFFPANLEIEGILGQNSEINNNLKTISKIAATRLTVLLEGETGSGKELFARIIHHNSNRKKFIAVNCGAISQGLIESELFGHNRGSFTGSTTDRKGKFEEANEGTIFLDEIGELDLQAQVRLLRVLDVGEIQRVGSDKTYKVDVRVIAATNRSLEDMVSEGSFREDLYYRLSACHLHIPPLRERRDEIELLFEYFVKRTMADNNMPALPVLSDEVRKFLFYEYGFPGNIRELRNIAQYITHIYSGEPVAVRDLPEKYKTKVESKTSEIKENWDIRKYAKDKAEKEMLISALDRLNGAVSEVCKELKISRSRIYQLFSKHKIVPNKFRKK